MSARSFTQWSIYDNCPRQFKYRYKDRLPRPDREKSPAAVRGTEVHESIEHFMQGKRDDLHAEINDNYLEFMQGLKKYEYTPELRFAIDAEWKPCDWKDEACLVRGFIDLVVQPDHKRINGFEWKTGKFYEEHLHQKMLYGMILLILYPEVKDVTITGVYLDSQENRAVTYRREMLGTYKWMWDRRFDMMEKDLVCAPNPSFKCRWCDFAKNNGGPCSF